MKTLLELTDQNLTSNAGLILIGPYLKSKEFRQAITDVSNLVKTSGVISDIDIICSWIALLCLGKSDYEAIEEFRKDEFFKTAIGIETVPSSSILRQRIEALSEEVADVLREFNTAIIAHGFEETNRVEKQKRKSTEAVNIEGTYYAVVDSDVTVLDNSDSNKEGVEWTYKKCDGYAPMISYIGASGYMLNNELREGDMHSNCDGTLEYFEETIAMAKEITILPLLMVLDSGNDDKKLLDVYENDSVYYVIKRNLRRESVQDWLDEAKQNPAHQRKGRDGSTVYYASTERTIVVEKREHVVRIVVVARERYWDKYGQMLVVPEMSVETYWTNLPCSETAVEAVYHMHGTMEQYHAELKSDMDIERLPSGKFHANMLHLLFSMIAFNLLRRVGIKMLKSGKAPGKRGRRLRLRTVLQSVMYMAGVIVTHAGRTYLRIFTGHAWSEAFYSSA
jgi:hypothetical protein